MSWRIQGLSNSFSKADSANETRQIGQLIHIDEDGKATTLVGDGNLALPLIRKFDHLTDKVAEVQFSGIASIYVENATNIHPKVPVAVGATGKGIKAAEAGDFIIGMALETPSGNGVNIPVMFTIIPAAGNIY